MGTRTRADSSAPTCSECNLSCTHDRMQLTCQEAFPCGITRFFILQNEGNTRDSEVHCDLDALMAVI